MKRNNRRGAHQRPPSECQQEAPVKRSNRRRKQTLRWRSLALLGLCVVWWWWWQNESSGLGLPFDHESQSAVWSAAKAVPPRLSEPTPRRKAWEDCSRKDFSGLDLIGLELADPVANDDEPPPRIYCFLMTHSRAVQKHRAILDTWGPRCDRILLASNHTDPSYHAIRIDAPASYEHLWSKLNETLRYIEGDTNGFRDYDWYLKADDDTFVVLENLRAFLGSPQVRADLQKGDPLIYGRNLAYPKSYDQLQLLFFNEDFPNQAFGERFLRRFNGSDRLVYTSGGAGYVMNPSFAKGLLDSMRGEDTIRGEIAEDMGVGFNMLYRGIRPRPSLDEEHLQLFHPEYPSFMHDLPPDRSEWLHEYHRALGGIRSGPACCSRHSISFHHVPPYLLRHMDHRVYHCRPQPNQTGGRIEERVHRSDRPWRGLIGEQMVHSGRI